MLQEAANVSAHGRRAVDARAGGGIFVVVLGVNLVTQDKGREHLRRG